MDPKIRAELLFMLTQIDTLAAVFEQLVTSMKDPLHTQLSYICEIIDKRSTPLAATLRPTGVDSPNSPSFELRSLARAFSSTIALLSTLGPDIYQIRKLLAERADNLSQLEE